MRRKLLIETITKIQDAITDTELLERLHVRIVTLKKTGKKVHNIGDLLAALNQFSIRMSKLTDAEREVLTLLDLHHLNEPKNWPKLISTDRPELLKSVFSNLRRLRSSLQYFRRVLALGHEELNFIEGDNETISILVLPDDQGQDTPEKIANILTSVQELYQSFATIEHIENVEPLTIIGMDSGNEKSIELQGNSELLEKMKELLYALWMQVLPSHNQYLSDQLKLILKSLPILERVDELATLGKLDKENAALVKRQLLNSLEQIIRSNTIIEEMYETWQRDPRVAMQLTPRLTTQNVIEEEEEAPEYATQQRVNPFAKTLIDADKTLIDSTDNVVPVIPNTTEPSANVLSDTEKQRFLNKLKTEISESK